MLQDLLTCSPMHIVASGVHGSSLSLTVVSHVIHCRLVKHVVTVVACDKSVPGYIFLAVLPFKSWLIPHPDNTSHGAVTSADHTA